MRTALHSSWDKTQESLWIYHAPVTYASKKPGDKAGRSGQNVSTVATRVVPKSYQREGQPRKTENYLLVNHVLCYKKQGNYVVCNELPSGTI